MYFVTTTTVTGNVIREPNGEENRCSNCGRPTSEARERITGGMIEPDEWACCDECVDEMVEKGCCFEEYGDGIYRKQKY